MTAFGPNSRYAGVETTEFVEGTGERRIRHLRRRFVPPPDPAAAPVGHTVREGERLDHLAAQYFGDPTQFWRLCDANRVLRPEELEATGRRIDVPLPGGV